MVFCELEMIELTASAAESWSILVPLRPELSLPFMTVTTKAAMEKHATMILRGAEKVMVEGLKKEIGTIFEE
jgi:hypothetical protein